MQKIFDYWNNIKKKIDLNKSDNFYIKQRDIWSVRMWKNIWFEEDWKWEDYERPVIVMKKIWIMYLCLAMTTKWKSSDFYFKVNENSFVILSQLKSFDMKRFHYKKWVVSEDIFKELQKKLKTFWF